jgi:hypothetical protein
MGLLMGITFGLFDSGKGAAEGYRKMDKEVKQKEADNK